MEGSAPAVLLELHRWVVALGLMLVLFAEALRPLVEFPGERARVGHALSNLGIWLIGFVLADVLLTPWLRGLSPEPGLRLWAVLLDSPLWLQGAAGILLLDFGSWLLHRLTHGLRWLWLLHAVHHSDASLDVTTALRFHPVETMITATWLYSLVVAIGLPAWVVLARSLLAVPLTYWQHANLRTPAGVDRVLRLVLATQAMHRLHHSPEIRETNSNFGVIFSFWDRLFGTYRSPLADRAPRCGLRALDAPAYQSVIGMLLTPVRARQLPRL